MQEHIHTRKVISGRHQLLPIELDEFWVPGIMETAEEQGAGTHAGVYVHTVFDTMPDCPIVPETACAVRFQAFFRFWADGFCIGKH